MKYKRVVGYGENERFVIFELNGGAYAIACCVDGENEVMFEPTWLSAAKYVPVYLTDNVPPNLLDVATHNLDLQNETSEKYQHALCGVNSGGLGKLKETEEELERLARNSGKTVAI